MRFRTIYIEITNQCGMACSFCPSRPSKRAIMSLDDFQKVLTQIEGKTKNIALHVWGDPLVLPNVRAYLDLALKANLKVRLVTSGMPLASHKKEILSHKALLQCAVSLNSVAQFSLSKKNTYFQTLFEWCDYHTKCQLESFINLRLWKNQGEEGEFVEYALEKINSYFDIRIPPGFGYDASYQLAPKIRFVSSRYFEWPSKNAPIVPQSTCHGLRSQLGILHDLRVVPCCMDGDGTMELGNLQSQKLNEILLSPMALEIKNGFDEGRVVQSMCSHCGFRERFVEKNLH